MELTFQEHRFVAHAQRGLYWPAQKALLVADLHWGKDSTFRAHGIPVSRGLLVDELARLEQLCEESGAERLWVLGDLCHSRDGLDAETIEIIAEFCTRLPPRVLVEGNHDRGLKRLVSGWGFEWWDEGVEVAGIALHHHPRPGIHGHLHPTYQVQRPGERVRLACFHWGSQRLALPAFTGFSNGPPVTLKPGEHVAVIAGTQVFRASS